MAFILFIGGIRSGKSRLAHIWAEAAAPERLLLSVKSQTQEITPSGRKTPGPDWRVLEEPLEPLNRLKIFRQEQPHFDGSLTLDSIGGWIANLMSQNLHGSAILRKVNTLAHMFNEIILPCAIVSDEAGLTPPPQNTVTRKYIELLGLANQILAKNAHCAVMVNAGLPLVLRGSMPAILDRALRGAF